MHFSSLAMDEWLTHLDNTEKKKSFDHSTLIYQCIEYKLKAQLVEWVNESSQTEKQKSKKKWMWTNILTNSYNWFIDLKFDRIIAVPSTQALREFINHLLSKLVSVPLVFSSLRYSVLDMQCLHKLVKYKYEKCQNNKRKKIVRNS